MQIDSGVWPGVCRISSSTSPSERRSPSSSRSMGNSTCAAAPNAIRAPVAAASSRWPERKSAWTWVSITRSITQALGGRVGEVLGDVALRVDHHRAPGRRSPTK